MKTFQEQYSLLASYNDQKNSLVLQRENNEITISQYCGRVDRINTKIRKQCPDALKWKQFGSKCK